MRKNIEILWLDDEISGFAHEDRKSIVEDILSDKGYVAEIHEFENFNSAFDVLSSSKRYDFFISDYNLDGSYTGLSYLEKIREINGYKQFVILYSNNEYSEIKKDVIKVLDDKSLDIFSNFTFFSIGNGNEEEYFKRAIDVILCRWDELNAIRGRYMYENAELEYKLKEKLNCLDDENVTYKNLIYRLFNGQIHRNRRKLYKDIKEDWLKMANKRNMLAHVEEKYDKEKGYFIESQVETDEEPIRIYESNLDIERKKIVKLKKEIVDFLNRDYY